MGLVIQGSASTFPCIGHYLTVPGALMGRSRISPELTFVQNIIQLLARFRRRNIMRRILIATIVSLAAGAAAYAQAPAPKPAPNAEHPPTNRMDQVTPTMKAPGGQELAPTNRIDQAVPPMKSTDAQSTGESTQASSLVPDENWIGRSVYSSDGKELGKVASVKKDESQSRAHCRYGRVPRIGYNAHANPAESNQGSYRRTHRSEYFGS